MLSDKRYGEEKASLFKLKHYRTAFAISDTEPSEKGVKGSPRVVSHSCQIGITNLAELFPVLLTSSW